jgi:ankyrin repeat protein
LGHNLAAIQALLRLGANPELKDCDGASALMMAAAVPSIAAMMGLKLVPKDQVPSNMLHHHHPEPKF